MNLTNLSKEALKHAILMTDKPCVILQVSNKEIDNADYSALDTLVEVLRDCGPKAKRKILIIFDCDVEDKGIFEIENICFYMKNIFNRCPEFLYFINDDLDEYIINTYVLCLADVKRVSSVLQNGMMVLQPRDRKCFEKTVSELKQAVAAYGEEVGDGRYSRRLCNKLDKVLI